MRFQKVLGTEEYRVNKVERDKFHPREEKVEQTDQNMEMDERDEIDEINAILEEMNGNK